MQLSRPPENRKTESDPSIVKKNLIDELLANRISMEGLVELREMVREADLSDIIQRIYDLNEKYILNLSAVEGLMRRLNDLKNGRRNARFFKKIKRGFRDLPDASKKVILAEGDSWFNYPVILTDIIDRIGMEKDFALYSLASGGDWLLNMLTARQYVEELSLLHPDVFLISGGGNDLVGSRRLAAIVEPKGCDEFASNAFAQCLMKNARTDIVALHEADFNEGARYLSKDFFALLMFFHLQYFFLIRGILQGGAEPDKPGKFPGIKIITQGYDYAIPSYKKGFGADPSLWYVPFIRLFLGHGGWLKTPLQMRGINDAEVQRKILYAMIYLFNEMMIDLGRVFEKRAPGSVFHIDSRGWVGADGWTDELHGRPDKIMNVGKVFVHCIRTDKLPTYDNVFVVTKFFS